jgi:ABC-type transport system substrate-binding protein
MFYGMNLRMAPFDKPLVRRALAQAFNREAYAKEVLGSKHLPAHQIVPPGMPGYSPRNKLATYDPGKAAELLEEAGHPGGAGIPELVIASVSHSDAAKRELEMFRKDLSALGISVKPLFVENWEIFKKGIEEGTYPMYRYALYADIPDPEDFFPDLVGTGTSHNFTGYSEEAIDALLAKARTETDPVKRTALYREAEKRVLGEPPLIPVLFLSTQVVFRKELNNVELPATGTPYMPFRKISLAGKP